MIMKKKTKKLHYKQNNYSFVINIHKTIEM